MLNITKSTYEKWLFFLNLDIALESYHAAYHDSIELIWKFKGGTAYRSSQVFYIEDDA